MKKIGIQKMNLIVHRWRAHAGIVSLYNFIVLYGTFHGYSTFYRNLATCSYCIVSKNPGHNQDVLVPLFVRSFVREIVVVNQISNCSAISWREQVPFDEMKQLFAGRHVNPLGHIIQILSQQPLLLRLNGEATNTNGIVVGLTWPGKSSYIAILVRNQHFFFNFFKNMSRLCIN